MTSWIYSILISLEEYNILAIYCPRSLDPFCIVSYNINGLRHIGHTVCRFACKLIIHFISNREEKNLQAILFQYPLCL